MLRLNSYNQNNFWSSVTEGGANRYSVFLNDLGNQFVLWRYLFGSDLLRYLFGSQRYSEKDTLLSGTERVKFLNSMAA